MIMTVALRRFGAKKDLSIIRKDQSNQAPNYIVRKIFLEGGLILSYIE